METPLGFDGGDGGHWKANYLLPCDDVSEKAPPALIEMFGNSLLDPVQSVGLPVGVILGM